MVPAIEVDRLTRKFNGFTAVDGLSFTVYRNEIFGLLGPNGAGKTTTISMICGLLQATGGTVRINTTQSSSCIASVRSRSAKSLIGYCPQENIFYPRLTCMEQLVFMGSIYDMPTRLARTRSYTLLEMMGLSDKANALAGILSGGMKRRLNICLALVHNPEILILDEPEAGLDPQSRLLVRDFIRNFGKERTIILTTHNMDEADRLVHRVAIMDYGKLLMLDTPDQLKRKSGDGDLIELTLETSDNIRINSFIDRASSIAQFVSRDLTKVVFRHKSVIDVSGTLKNIALDEGIKISEFKMRESTLEDVFIKLTGRNLRQ